MQENIKQLKNTINKLDELKVLFKISCEFIEDELDLILHSIEEFGREVAIDMGLSSFLDYHYQSNPYSDSYRFNYDHENIIIERVSGEKSKSLMPLEWVYNTALFVKEAKQVNTKIKEEDTNKKELKEDEEKALYLKLKLKYENFD